MSRAFVWPRENKRRDAFKSHLIAYSSLHSGKWTTQNRYSFRTGSSLCQWGPVQSDSYKKVFFTAPVIRVYVFFIVRLSFQNS
jgi:hypothetical protein